MTRILSTTLALSVVARNYIIPSTRHLSSLLHHPSSPSTPKSTSSGTSQRLHCSYTRLSYHPLPAWSPSPRLLCNRCKAALLVSATQHILPRIASSRQASSVPMMGRMFKKTQSKVQQETPKANMLKKFGGKFKKAFSKKQQVHDYPRLPCFTITLNKLTLLSSIMLSQRMKPMSRMFSLGH